jgi:hypothetical protein
MTLPRAYLAGLDQPSLAPTSGVYSIVDKSGIDVVDVVHGAHVPGTHRPSAPPAPASPERAGTAPAIPPPPRMPSLGIDFVDEPPSTQRSISLRPARRV